MKTKRSVILLLVAATLINSCKKNYLPDESTSGTNTFGCKVNGEIWIPKGTDANSGQNVLAKYVKEYPANNGYTLIITATNYKDNRSSFNIGMDSIRLQTGSTIKITNKKGFGSATYFVRTETQNNVEYIRYLVNDSISGELTITHLDETKQIISGTFWFDAVNRFNDIVQIREGRFDIKYTR